MANHRHTGLGGASTVNEADKLLNRVMVEEVQHLARRDHDWGILVTRTGAGQFTVELGEQVPYGLTLETGTSRLLGLRNSFRRPR